MWKPTPTSCMVFKLVGTDVPIVRDRDDRILAQVLAIRHGSPPANLVVFTRVGSDVRRMRD